MFQLLKLSFLWIWILVGCADDQQVLLGSVSPVAAGLGTEIVDIYPVSRETIFDGSIEAINESTVAAQTSGRVLELPYDVGDYIAKDEVIVRLTDNEQRSRVEAAKGSLGEAQARLTEASVAFERTRDVFERKLIAKADFDRAAANLGSAKARVESARAVYEEAQQNLEYTVIRAPYAGTVVQRHVQLGETVGPGRLLMTGLSMEHLRVVVEIPQQHIGPLRKHSQARIFVNGHSLPATELRIPPKADAATHTFRVLATLPEGDHGVYPGTLVKVAFVSGEEQRMLVSSAAVVRRGEVTGVYVVGDDNLVTLRYIRVATTTSDGRVPILSGLMRGERVALDPIAAGVAYKNQRLSAGDNA